MDMVNKILSGRLIMVVVFSVAYCVVIILLAGMAIKKIVTPEIFLGIFAGFSGIVSMIVTSYFGRTDRSSGNGKDTQNHS